VNLNALPPEQVQSLLSALSDVIILTDAKGHIQDIQVSGKELQRLHLDEWKGKNLSEVSSLDSLEKIRQLFVPPKADTSNAWRHVNLRGPADTDVPLQIMSVAFAQNTQFWLFGRDLTGVSQMQKRLVDAHQSMERDYLRLRHMEARYRLLFESVADPMLVVDVAQRRVMEANHAAQSVLKDAVKRLPGTDIAQCFEPHSRDSLDALLRSSQASGRTETARVRTFKATEDCQMYASVFVQEGGPQFLLRLQAMVSQRSAKSVANAVADEWFSNALENAPIGFIVTDRSGLIKAGNAEICAMLGLSTSSQLVDKNLEDYLARGSVDLGVLLNNLRQSRILRGFATELRSVAGVQLAVDMAAVTLVADELTYGFFIRDIRLGGGREKSATSGMADSVEQLSQLVGRMPMKDIVGETSTMIERMCIQAALELTHNNRASAAEMLGLSRQSLYVKLHRYGMVSEIDSE
jgi:transcriptional regulator PpsR